MSADYAYKYSPAQSWRMGNGSTFSRTFDFDSRITAIGMGNAASLSCAYDNANWFAECGESSKISLVLAPLAGAARFRQNFLY
jgi:hypothetical protein